MEELIWKYIDGECTDDELKQVKKMLDSDKNFETTYTSLSLIDEGLKAASKVKASAAYTENLQAAIVAVYRSKKPIAILPLPWIIGCGLLMLAGAIFSIYYQGTSSTYINMPNIDPKIMDMTSWVTISFLLLLLIDLVLSKTNVIQRHTGFKVF